MHGDCRCRAAFEELKKSGDAIIINISMTLHYGATWWQSHACAAKAAVDALTRNLGLEWGWVESGKGGRPHGRVTLWGCGCPLASCEDKPLMAPTFIPISSATLASAPRGWRQGPLRAPPA
jgi:hypothetical protein